MRTIAIPIHRDRVMPRFGCTREVIIVTVEADSVLTTKHLIAATQDLQPVFVEEHVSVVICGGIHPRFQQRLQEQQIELVWGVVGPWRDVLQAYLDGTLQHNRNLYMHHRYSDGCQLCYRHQRRR